MQARRLQASEPVALRPFYICAAVSQRNVLAHAPWLEAQRQDLLEALLEFFEERVQQRFPLRDYTFDVYITTAGKVAALALPVKLLQITLHQWTRPAASNSTYSQSIL